MSWKFWEPIEVIVSGVKKQVQGVPAVVSWAQGQLHVFLRGKHPDANIYYGTNKSNSWQWSQLPAMPPLSSLESSLAAVSWGMDRIDLFAVGGDKKVYHYAGTGTSWDGFWGAVPGDMTTASAPAAASWKRDRMDVFIRASNNQLSNLHFENEPGKQWSPWANAGGHMKVLAGAPAAAASGPNRIDCFALGAGDNKHLLHAMCDGTAFDAITDQALRMKCEWANPDAAGGVRDDSQQIAGSPAAASLLSGSGRVDVFARSSANRLIHREFMKDRWTGKWEELGTDTVAGDPAAVSWGNGGTIKRMDCFALGNPGILKHTWWV